MASWPARVHSSSVQVKQKHMRIKTIFLLLLAVLPLSAADKFVTFAEQNGAVSLKGATISYEASEPLAVRLAASSLMKDFQSKVYHYHHRWTGGHCRQ